MNVRRPTVLLAKEQGMSLSAFIRNNMSEIISEWERFAQSLKPEAADMGSLTFRDHIQEILAFVADDIESPQTTPEQVKKSLGHKDRNSTNSPAETHAALRLMGGFNLDQMVSEYRALRASVIKLWGVKERLATPKDIVDIIRFNESIDQELTESISFYTKKVGHAKNLFLGILSHDIRNPLSAALLSAKLLPKIGALNERQTMLASQIVDCSERASEIVVNLFDLIRARFGSGLPVIRANMDMAFVGRKLVEEMCTIHPERIIEFNTQGEVEGEWDKARVGQALANLIGNAVQYGFKDLPIKVDVQGNQTEVVMSVHNYGVPIPDDIIGTIFDSLTRGGEDDAMTGEVHLGLGLYITRQIVTSHGGTIDVTSSEKDGTSFHAHFPREAKSH
jgi:signal transduction histidine kinase